jgi:hypothetical protein
MVGQGSVGLFKIGFSSAVAMSKGRGLIHLTVAALFIASIRTCGFWLPTNRVPRCSLPPDGQ